MDANRKHWNEQQKLLQAALQHREDHRAVELFLQQHAEMHAAEMSGCGLWSINDELLDGLPDMFYRVLPTGAEHSVAWLLWHMARCEDITMNMLVGGREQVLTSGGWDAELRVAARDTGSLMTYDTIATLSAGMNLRALHGYRMAVGRATRQVIASLPAGALRQPVDPQRVRRVLEIGAVLPEASALTDYWGSRTIAGLLLMPPTRHLMLHFNEIARVRAKLR